jgi:hypothetical protein
MYHVWGRDAYSISMGKPEGKRLLEDLGVDERIILNWIFMSFYMFAWNGLIWQRIGTDAGFLERR